MSLAEGRGFAIDERPTAFYPVGYPAFLAALFTLAGPSLLAAKLANIALQIVILLLTLHLAERLFRSAVVGRISLALLAVYPNYIAHTALTSSESLFTAALLLAVFAQIEALDRGSPSVTALAGLAFGVAALIKPQAAPVPVLVWALGRAWMPVPRPRRLVMLGILCVAMAVPLSAWTVRKYRVFGTVFFVSTNSGVNLLIGNNPAATGKYLPLELFPDDSGPEREPYLDREALRLALEFMTRHPMAALQIWPRKLWHLYGRDGDGFDWTMAGIGTDDRLRTLVWRVAQINKVYYLVLVLISGVGFLHFASTRRRADAVSAAGMLPFWLTALFTGVYLICFADPRFHFPLMPWVVMYGAWLISLGLSGPPVSGSIGGSYGPMGSDGCRGTRLQRSGRCDGGTGGPAGSAEATGENVHRASPPALTRLPTPPLLGPEPRPPSQRAVHRVSGDCVRRDTPAETPLARPGPLVLGSI